MYFLNRGGKSLGLIFFQDLPIVMVVGMSFKGVLFLNNCKDSLPLIHVPIFSIID